MENKYYRLSNNILLARCRTAHIEAGEQADMATEALAASDQRVRTPSDDREHE